MTIARSAIWLVALAAGCWLAAFALRHELEARFGVPSVNVNVRWTPQVTDSERAQLERRFGLIQGERKEGTTYNYYLTDMSTANIRAIVRSPVVLDTHHIDRSQFRPDATAESAVLDERAQRWWAIGNPLIVALGVCSWLFGALGLLVAARSRTARVLAHSARRHWHPVDVLSSWITSRIPEVSAEGAALFRILFTAASVVLFTTQRVTQAALPATLSGDVDPVTYFAWRSFSAVPILVDAIAPWLVIAGALVIAGVWTRGSFAALTCGGLAWGAVQSMRYGHHPFSSLLLTMVCLIPSRWGDAWSLEALWRGRRHRSDTTNDERTNQLTAREYGYTMWVPGVVMGVTFFAAAVAKLRSGGIGWILNGTVKYHFLTDASVAPVDWGLRFGLIPWVAVALSFGAIAIESSLLPAALIGSPAVRMAAGTAAMSLLTGFYLFQGLFWPGWWILLLSFLPWQQLCPARSSGAIPRVPRTRPSVRLHAALIIAVFAQQVVVSSLKLEIRPLLSTYDMYSKTYPGPDAYEREAIEGRWLIARLADDTRRECALTEADAQAVKDAAPARLAEAVAPLVLRCFPDADRVDAVTLEEARRDVDWKRGRARGTIRIQVLGPVAPLVVH